MSGSIVRPGYPIEMSKSQMAALRDYCTAHGEPVNEISDGLFSVRAATFDFLFICREIADEG